MTELTVGQELWYVPTDKRWGKPHYVKVEKIGRKWATLEGNQGRIDVNTLFKDGAGYLSAGRCYASKEDYEIEHAADVLWSRFRDRLSRMYNRPYGIRSEEIERVASVLRVPLDETP